MSSPTDYVSITVNGVEISSLLLLDIRIRSSVLETSMLTVRYDDANFDLIDGASFEIGAALVAKVGSMVSETTVFEGEVVAIATERFANGSPETVIEAMDRSHRLSATVKPKTYLKQSSSAIVSTIAGEHGLQAVVTATDKVHDYVLKTTNDRRFLDDLADEVGFEWFVTGDTLTFRPRPEPGVAVVSLGWSSDPPLLDLNIRASGVDGAKQVEVHSWDDAGSTEIVGRHNAATVVESAIGANSLLATDTYRTGANTFGSTMVLAPGVLLDQGEADLRAKAVAANLQASTLRVTGVCEADPRIVPGVWIEITDCGTKLSGKYYVTDVEHYVGIQQSLMTRFRLNGRRAGGLAGSGAAHRAPMFGQVGFVIGVVTNVKDDEKRMHRIKVRFPTLPEVESEWARVVTLGGEKASGMEARPEVDDEVLVGFEQGDVRRPFVIGGLLSATDAYRTGTINSDGSINKRGIRTRAGHKLEMFDGDSKSATAGRYIALVGADGVTELRLGDEDMSMKTKNGHPITIQSGPAKITIDNGKIIVTADSIEFRATQAFKVQGATVDLKANTAIGIDAQASLKLHGAMVNVTADGIAEVKGSLLKLN